MSKKHAGKKRHSQATSQVKRQMVAEEIADQKDRERKRMDPLARSVLLGDLVLLAVTELLTRAELIPPILSNGLTLVGVGLLMFSLYVQFGGGGRNRGPRL